MGSHFRHVQMFTHEYSYDLDCSEGEIRQLVVYDQYPMYCIQKCLRLKFRGVKNIHFAVAEMCVFERTKYNMLFEQS